jgi:hypothetical protein
MRTQDKGIPGIESEVPMGDAAMDEVGDKVEPEDDVPFEKARTFGMIHMEYLDPRKDQLFSDLFTDCQNPLDASIDTTAPIPSANPVDPIAVDDDEDEDSE